MHSLDILTALAIAAIPAGLAFLILTSKRVRIAHAVRSHRKAVAAVRSYHSASNRDWSVLVAVALERAECEAANRVAALIDPDMPRRAF